MDGASGCKNEANAEMLQTCLLSICQQGAPLVPKRGLYVKRTKSTPQLIYYLSKQFRNEFMVSVTNFKSSIEHDVHLLNCGPITSKTDDIYHIKCF